MSKALDYYYRNRKRINREKRQRYRQRKEQGLCPICGGTRDGETILCEDCKKKERDYYPNIKHTGPARYKKWYDKHKNIAKIRNREKYWNRVKKRLCPNCGSSEKVETGFTLCKACRLKKEKSWTS